MATENAIVSEQEIQNEEMLDSFDLDELEAKLQEQIDQEIEELDFLHAEKEKIGNPESLGEVIKDVVWEQFILQIGTVAGDDFIKENRGMKLDLRDEAHIQTGENFEQQKYATHNIYVDYEEKGKEYRSNFYTDPANKPKAKQKQEQRYNEKTNIWETYDPIDGKWKKTLRENYREPYEADRRKDAKNKFGSKSVNKDHMVSDADIARDAEAAAYMTSEERVSMANSKENLHDLDSAANQSKSDHDGEKWLNHKRTGKKGEGQTNGEYFGISEKEFLEKYDEANKKINEETEKKKAEHIEAGKKSQREEALRIGGKALRAVVMQLLAELIKEIISKLVKWFKSSAKSLGTLLDGLKDAIRSFVGKMKTHLINAGNTVLNTVATAIFGPIINTIKKVWMLLKTGWKTLKDAVKYIKDPANKDKPIGRLLLETGKIVIAGISGVAAIVLGEVIEKGLIAAFPAFAVEIPLLGSLASVLGIFLGAVVSGIIGAIALNLIQKRIEKSQKKELVARQLETGNEILVMQEQLRNVQEARLEAKKTEVESSIRKRHQEAAAITRNILDNIERNNAVNGSSAKDRAEMEDLFRGLEGNNKR